MPLKQPTQCARTAKRQHELEQVFQKNKEAITADLNDYTLKMQEVAKKWKVTDRMIRRWAERLGVDVHERRALAAKNKKPTGIVNKRPPNDVAPQAHKLAGLW